MDEEVSLTLLFILIPLHFHQLPLLLPLNPGIHPRLRPKTKDEDPFLILLLFLITSVSLLDLLLPLNPWVLLPPPPFSRQRRQDVSVPNTFTPPWGPYSPLLPPLLPPLLLLTKTL